MEARRSILLIDDHEATRDTLAEVLEDAGHQVQTAATQARALEILESRPFHLVLTDLKLPDGSGMEIMKRAKALFPHMPVVMITGHASIDNAVEATRLGAYEYLTKPVDLDKLRLVVANALHLGALEKQVENNGALDRIIGQSQAIESVKALIRQVARSEATVLIQGESGTGKELVANALQALSARAPGPFVRVNVAALPKDLVESELFGHEKGAFSGAIRLRKGRFELADGGTLFLDEIGEMPPEAQVKLLRVLQEREFERVGGTDTIPVDIRLLCATNQDLRARVSEGRFREDLFFRVNVVRIFVPPLRDRREDIPLLADFFRARFCQRYRAEKHFAPATVEALMRHDWTGNVRELENAVEGAVVRTPGDLIPPAALPEEIGGAAAPPAAEGLPPGLTMEEVERRYLLSELARVGGNKTQAAKTLGIGLKTLYRKLEGYGLSSDEHET
jgi:DNA-binding NtrC family response regulator